MNDQDDKTISENRINEYFYRHIKTETHQHTRSSSTTGHLKWCAAAASPNTAEALVAAPTKSPTISDAYARSVKTAGRSEISKIIENVSGNISRKIHHKIQGKLIF